MIYIYSIKKNNIFFKFLKQKCTKFTLLIFLISLIINFQIPLNSQTSSGENNSFNIDYTLDLDNLSKDSYRKGLIRVQFNSDIEKSIDKIGFQSTKDDYLKTGIPVLDKLNKKHGVYEYKPMLDDLYKISEASLRYKERHREWGLHLWYELKVDSKTDVISVIKDFDKLQEVKTAEPAFIKRLIEPIDYKPIKIGEEGSKWVPDDIYYPANQWHFNNTGQEIGGQNGISGWDVNTEAAWEIEKGNSDVLVAIIDNGMQFDHEDLVGNMWPDIGPEGISTTPAQHGTHVGGTVAAVSNNEIGVAGLAGGSGSDDGVRLMSIDIIDSDLSGMVSFTYAADNGAAISQNSWSVGTSMPGSLMTAIDYFNAEGGGTALDGGITIFAAGNDNTSTQTFPAAYSGAMAVAAHDNRGVRSGFSNYGNWVDIIAPGTNVASTDITNEYSFLSGTSMACPHVSGAAALIISNNYGEMTNEELWNRIVNSARSDIYDQNPDFDGLLGSGALDILAALQYAPNTVTFVVKEDSPDETPIENANVSVESISRTTDENGVVTMELSEGGYTAEVTASGYELETVNFSVVSSEKTVEVFMSDIITPPYNLEVNVDEQDKGEALFSWNNKDEFRYDDGVVVDELGFPSGNINSVMGAVHHNEAKLFEMTWYLTSADGPHENVNLWVLGLDGSGMPDRNNVYYTAENVSNTDNQWNLYEFPEPIDAPDGFFIGVSYDGYLALATDNGTGEPYEFTPNTQFAIFNIADPGSNFTPIENWDFELNFLLRGHGIDKGEINYNSTKNDKYSDNKNKPVAGNSIDNPMYAGNPQKNKYDILSFEGFNVYLNDDLIEPEITGEEFLFTELLAGNYTAGVQSVYTTGVSEIVEIDFEITDGAGHNVTFDVVDESTNPITDAVVLFDGVKYDEGEYLIEDVLPGIYNYSVSKDGYITVFDELEVVDQDITENVVLHEGEDDEYTVTFYVSHDGNPVEGAEITFDEEEYTTNIDGEVEIEDVVASFYSYRVEKEGYNTVEDNVIVNDDISINVVLESETYIVTFDIVDNEDDPVLNAVVTLNEVSNALGDYVFENIEPGTHQYSVSADGFHEENGEVIISDTDITEKVILSLVEEYYSLTIIAEPEDGGSVEGGGEYLENEEVQVTASENEGFEFINWTDIEGDFISNDDSFNFIMPAENTTLVANFEEVEYESYMLILNSEPYNGGKLNGGGIYYEHSEQTVKAEPNRGFEFIHWKDLFGNSISSDSIFEYQMPSFDVTLTAVFSEEKVSADEHSIHNELALYPNPASSKITVSSNIEIKNIKIIDVSGQVVSDKEVNDSYIELNVSEIRTGFYFMQIETVKGVVNERIQIVE